jgi:hypothetical protein
MSAGVAPATALPQPRKGHQLRTLTSPKRRARQPRSASRSQRTDYLLFYGGATTAMLARGGR